MTPNLDRLVARARRRMRVNRGLAAGGVAAVVAAGVALVWTVVGRAVTLPLRPPALGALLLAATVAAGTAAAAVRIPERWAARAADLWLGTADAFATAVEFRGRGELRLAALQAARAEEAAAGIRAFPQGPRVPVRLLGVAALLGLAAFGIHTVPNPQDEARARQDAREALAEAEAERLRDVAGELREQPAPAGELAARLEALADALEDAALDDALAQLGDERSELAGRLDRDVAAQRTALAGLARELDRHPLAAGDTPSEQLDALARALEEGALTDEQLADLAARLSELAGALPGAPDVAGALDAAAGAGAAGDPAGAASALSGAAGAAEAGRAHVAAQDRLARAEAALAEAEARLRGGEQGGGGGESGEGAGDSGQGDGG
ncbi:MAG TPA: hypothetical protein VM324_12035, partial [Egibacteraceae bacterium]|nr:hypothetical protein [Egibacteraceae bacterium]